MLAIAGLIAVFVATYFTYKTAKSTGRNPLWALATLGVGLGFQLIIPLFIGIILGIVYVAGGTPVDTLQNAIAGVSMIIGIVCLVLSFIGMGLIVRHVSTYPEDGDEIHIPPPPTFGDRVSR